MARSTSQARGKPETDEVAQPLRWGLHAAFHLGDPRLGTRPVWEGLREGLKSVLGRRPLVREAFVGCASTACAGLGLCGGVSFHGGPSAFLRPVEVVVWGAKDTMPQVRRIGLPMA